MSVVEREDGVEVSWEAAGEGPTVIVSPSYIQHPGVFAEFVEELRGNHRVVRYDPRGCGKSTRQGPYDMQTDVDDLIAVAEAAGPITAVIGNGDGSNRGIHAARQRPDVIPMLISLETVPLSRGFAEGTEALVGSLGVLEALVGMMRADYRSGLSAAVQRGNPGINEDDLRFRVDHTVEYSDHDAACGRLEAWIADDPGQDPAQLGDKLVVIYEGSGAWFPAELTERMREVLPDAQFVHVEGGAISRPELAAAEVARLTGAA